MNRKNLFIKSMLRQRLRTAILLLLVAAAAFAFVMRCVEYVAITEKLDSIGGYYRSVGFLQCQGGVGVGSTGEGDVYTGAEVVRASERVAYEDRRRVAGGNLVGLSNSDIDGRDANNVFWQYRFTDALFYGELIGKERAWGVYPPHVRLEVRVDEVLVGYPELAEEGQQLTLQYILCEEELAAERELYEELGEAVPAETPVDGMATGRRYLFRGIYAGNEAMGLPQRGEDNALVMAPLNSEVTLTVDTGGLGGRGIPEDPLWYVPAEEVAADAAATGLVGLGDNIARLRHNQSIVYLNTTADLGAIPWQMQFGHLILDAGRWITREDELGANPVVVVHEKFARIRGLEVGDRISVNIPGEQHLVSGWVANGYPHLAFEGSTGSEPCHELELEIVGLYHNNFDAQEAMPTTRYSLTMFMPDSVLPSDIEYFPFDGDIDERYIEYMTSGVMTGRYFREFDSSYVMESMYSFVLNDPDDEKAFLLENTDALSELGLTARFFATNYEEYRASAEPIKQAVALNAAVSCGALVPVLALVVVLHMRQRRKDFAIMRALGRSAKNASRDFVASVAMLGLPATAAGGSAAWYFALDRAAATVNRLGEAVEVPDLAAGFSISALWLPALVAAGFAVLLGMAALASRRLSSRPVLRLMQDRDVRNARKARNARARYVAMGYAQGNPKGAQRAPAMTGREARAVVRITRAAYGDPPTPAGSGAAAPKGRLRAACRFTLRSMARSTAKTVLAASVAILFVLALGWLQEAVQRSEAEVDRLNGAIPVHAEVVRRSQIDVPRYHYIGDVIRRPTVYSIVDSGYARYAYIEAAHQYAIAVAPAEDGSFPANWDETAGYDGALDAWANSDCYDSILGFNDIDIFTRENSRGFSDEIPGAARRFPGGERIEDMRIAFAEGFCSADFAFKEGEPIPIILSAPTMERRGLRPGGAAFINIADTSLFHWNEAPTGAWTPYPAVVIGVHNRNILGGLRDAALAPLAAVEGALGDETAYRTLSFSISPEHTGNLDEVEEALRDIVRSPRSGWVGLKMEFDDAELRTVVGAVEQNLQLLGLLFPFTVTLSVVIGSGLSLLGSMQGAKDAAIMRVLGSSKKRSRAILCAGQLSACLVSLAAGLLAVAVLGWEAAMSPALAGLYLTGAWVGSFAGALYATNRPPLQLLQAKE